MDLGPGAREFGGEGLSRPAADSHKVCTRPLADGGRRRELARLGSQSPYGGQAIYVKYRIYFASGNSHTQQIPDAGKRECLVIEISLDELLEERGRSFYWLARETGISHTTLWRLKKGRARGINFETLEKICSALACQPGDVMGLTNGAKKREKRRVSGKDAS